MNRILRERPWYPLPFLVGVDLGAQMDYTAIAVLERQAGTPAIYHGRHLERLPLHTPYPAIVEQVQALMDRPPLHNQAHLILDSTGVGAPVRDMFIRAGLKPVSISIHGGNEVTSSEHGWNVPKRDLVHTLITLLQSERVKFAEGVPEVATLVQELLNYRIEVSPAGHDSYNARTGMHDDLVLAAALAAWAAERVNKSIPPPPSMYVSMLKRNPRRYN